MSKKRYSEQEIMPKDKESQPETEVNKISVEVHTKIIERFDKAMEIVFAFEGGYGDNKYDKGGATKYGISLAFLKNTPQSVGDLDKDGIIDKDDVKLLTPEYAKKLYKKYFYDPVRADKINNSAIAIQLFDIAVNAGAKRAVLLIQSALLRMRLLDANGVDGVIGEITLEAINKAPVQILNNNLVNERVYFYNRIVQRDATQRIFMDGWRRRAEFFRI